MEENMSALIAAEQNGTLREVAFGMIRQLRGEQKALYEGTQNLSAKRKEQVLAERQAPRQFAELRSAENEIRRYLQSHGINVA